MSDHTKSTDPRMQRLIPGILEGRKILNDPYWNGGGAVCARTQAQCVPMYDTVCSGCGHPISWHEKP